MVTATVAASSNASVKNHQRITSPLCLVLCGLLAIAGCSASSRRLADAFATGLNQGFQNGQSTYRPANFGVNDDAPLIIRSEISGEFHGFEHGRVFALSNGQIWEQTSFDNWFHWQWGPKCVIALQGDAGRMAVEGVHLRVSVQRLK